MSKTKKFVEMTILVALVIVLQTLGSNIKIGAVSISLVLIPIVIGGALYGIRFGAALGGVFGLITFFAGLAGSDGFTNLLINMHPIGAPVLCLGKAVAAGAGSALIFKALKPKNSKLAAVVASAAAPVINTGLFIIGMLIMKDVVVHPDVNPDGLGAIYFLFIVCAGINFIIEFIINVVCLSAIYQIISNVKKIH